MSKYDEILNEVLNLFTRGWVYLVVLFASITVRIGMYLSGDKKLTLLQEIGLFSVALSVGIITTIICIVHYPSPPGTISIQAAFIIPFATLVSDRLVKSIMTLSPKDAADMFANKDFMAILKILFKTKKDKENL